MGTPNTTVSLNSFPSPAGAHDNIFKEMYGGTEHKINLTLPSLARSLPRSPYTDREAEGRVEAEL